MQSSLFVSTNPWKFYEILHLQFIKTRKTCFCNKAFFHLFQIFWKNINHRRRHLKGQTAHSPPRSENKHNQQVNGLTEYPVPYLFYNGLAE